LYALLQRGNVTCDAEKCTQFRYDVVEHALTSSVGSKV
jgi:hypothetical protein